MLGSFSSQFARLSDWRMVPDPWVARPLAALDAMVAAGEVDLDRLWSDVVEANIAVSRLLGPDAEVERRFLDEDYAVEDLAALAAKVRDSFGEGFRVGILRAGHGDWEMWTKTHPTQSEREAFELFFSQAGLTNGRPGFRRSRRPTRAQREKSVATDDRLASLREHLADDMESRKVGIAEVLMVEGWEGVEEDGEPVPFTLENRLRLLGYRGKHDGADYPGAHVEDGCIVQVVAGQAYGPAPLGDAVSAWILDASRKLESGREEWISEEVVDPLPGSQRGISATSEA